MASSILQEELKCSICINLYREPTTLPCGHTFCKQCIQKTAESSFALLCPECRYRVPEGLCLKRNTKMCCILENLTPRTFKKSDHQDDCFYCDDAAGKLCLDCEVPLCNNHLKKHTELVQHILTELGTPMHTRKCPVHKEVLRYKCIEDGVYICASCGLIGKHKGHTLEKLSELSNKEKDILQLVEDQLATKKVENEINMELVKKHKQNVAAKTITLKNQLIGLVRDMQKELEAIEHKILFEIAIEEQKIVDQESEVIQLLQSQISELSVQKVMVQSLKDSADPITVLNGKKSLTDRAKILLLSEVNLFVRELDSDLISVRLMSCLSKFTKCLPSFQKKRGFHVQDATFTFLPLRNIAGSLVLSLDGQDINNSTTSTMSLSSGQHYWEVETSNMPCWAVGVSYVKENDCSSLGRTSGSWCLLLNDHMQYKASHENQEVSVLTHQTVKALGVYLDYDSGKLSFYQLSNSPKHLCSMNTKFTQPLYFALCVSQSGCLKITK